MRAGETASVHEGIEAVRGVVGESYCLRFVVEGHDGYDWSERLELRQRRRVVDATEHRRFDVEALCQFTTNALATDQEIPRTGRDGVIDDGDDSVGGRLADDWSE